jgi:hypothetical protein
MCCCDVFFRRIAGAVAGASRFISSFQSLVSIPSSSFAGMRMDDLLEISPLMKLYASRGIAIS